MRFAGYALLAPVMVFFALIAVLPARSASFDCNKASHPLEKTICANPALSALDSEVAALYRAKLAILFDKLTFRGQQRDWQQILRTHCARTCDPIAVRRDYIQQRDTLKMFNQEQYSASYKTADVAALTIRHTDATRFGFDISRDLADDTPRQLCNFPGAGDAVATLASPARARWSDGNCTIDFAFTRDAGGHVARIDLTASPMCKRYCSDRKYGLDDVYLPDNNWVAGNQ